MPMPKIGWTAAVAASMAIHACVGVSLMPSFTGPQKAGDEDRILITYPNVEVASSSAAREVKLAHPAPQPKPIRYENFPSKSKRAATGAARASDESRREETRSKPVVKDPAEPSSDRPKTGSELLADPAKGKIFVGYFGRVKERIYRKLLDKYRHEAGDRGSVSLAFILSPDGLVQRVSVIQKESSADPALRSLAVECLKEAAPFGAFPEEIASQPISFTLTVYFDQI